jgi:hypothetical protein
MAKSWFSNQPEKGARASRLFSNPKTAAKRNLGIALRKATLATNENCREFLRVSVGIPSDQPALLQPNTLTEKNPPPGKGLIHETHNHR